jgi:hypothetical protein
MKKLDGNQISADLNTISFVKKFKCSKENFNRKKMSTKNSGNLIKG